MFVVVGPRAGHANLGPKCMLAVTVNSVLTLESDWTMEMMSVVCARVVWTIYCDSAAPFRFPMSRDTCMWLLGLAGHANLGLKCMLAVTVNSVSTSESDETVVRISVVCAKGV